MKKKKSGVLVVDPKKRRTVLDAKREAYHKKHPLAQLRKRRLPRGITLEDHHCLVWEKQEALKREEALKEELRGYTHWKERHDSFLREKGLEKEFLEYAPGR